MLAHRPLALLSLAALLVACGGTQATDTPAAQQPAAQITSVPANPEPAAPGATAAPETTAAPPPTAAPAAPAAPSGDAKEAVLAASRAQLSSGPFRSVTTVTTEGKTSEITAEFVPPSSLRSVIVDEGTQTEMVILGEQMWMKQGAEWTAMPGGGPQIGAMLAEFAQDPESRGVAISNAQYVGPDVVNGTPTWVYTYDATFGEGEGVVQSTNKMWVSVATGLPLKQEGASDFMGKPSTSSAILTYDPSITISPPVQ